MAFMADETNRTSVLDKLSPFLVILAVGLAFAVGALWQKVNLLQKGTTNTAGTADAATISPLSLDNLKQYAKDLKLNTKNFNECLDEGKYAQKVKDELAYGQEVGVSGTPGFFINGRFLGGAFPFETFKEIIDLELEGKANENPKTYSENLQKYIANNSFNPVPKEIKIDGSQAKGEGKVTIVEFSDFECPFCARHFQQTYPQIMSEYVDKGLVKYVFKHFPLSFHKDAQIAAEASECAGEQGKFWEMHDKLYSVAQ